MTEEKANELYTLGYQNTTIEEMTRCDLTLRVNGITVRIPYDGLAFVPCNKANDVAEAFGVKDSEIGRALHYIRLGATQKVVEIARDRGYHMPHDLTHVEALYLSPGKDLPLADTPRLCLYFNGNSFAAGQKFAAFNGVHYRRVQPSQELWDKAYFAGRGDIVSRLAWEMDGQQIVAFVRVQGGKWFVCLASKKEADCYAATKMPTQ